MAVIIVIGLWSDHEPSTSLMKWTYVIFLTRLDLSAAFDTIDHHIFFLNVFLLGLVCTSTAVPWIKSCLLNRSFYVNVETLSLLFFNFSMVFLKDLFLDFSSYIPLLSVLSHLIHLQIIISMRMIFNFSYHSRQLTLHTVYLSS
jgi:hypothetical protein